MSPQLLYLIYGGLHCSPGQCACATSVPVCQPSSALACSAAARRAACTEPSRVCNRARVGRGSQASSVLPAGMKGDGDIEGGKGLAGSQGQLRDPLLASLSCKLEGAASRETAAGMRLSEDVQPWVLPFSALNLQRRVGGGSFGQVGISAACTLLIQC
jgi:hypothetical protein